MGYRHDAVLRIASGMEGGGGSEHAHTNRLIDQTSPYLLQHAHNPVDWWPWSSEALDEARRADKPIFLSVGYSTCHWCHVMERESFEDPRVAARLNEGFVPIKVDREERPDIDKIYMLATQLLTGQGGWPNSVFLTPDGRPFFAGTYFPPEDRYGRPGFLTVLSRLHTAWTHSRDEISQQASQVAKALQEHDPATAMGSQVSGALSPMQIQHAVARMLEQFDTEHGGFGSAPKFPPHPQLRLILQQLRRAQNPPLRQALLLTLDKMCRGGIYDHVGGGFHRYSTDAEWFLPHFEKMLYDNAQLAWIYADAHELEPRDRYKRTATQTCDWVLRKMTDPHGGFYSALDADSQGQEGLYYLWEKEEIHRNLPRKQAQLFCGAFGVMSEGNFRDPVTGERPGSNVLYRAEPCRTLSKCLEISQDKVARMLSQCLETIRRHRNDRVPPARDEKVLTAWNAMMISALVRCGGVFGRKQYLQAATKAATFLWEQMRDSEGNLLRTWRNGQAKIHAYLEDYALLAGALLDLAEATGEEEHENRACELAEAMVERFADQQTGQFYFTAGGEELLMRPADWLDNATPSPAGAAVEVLARLARRKQREDFAALVDKALAMQGGLIRQAPTAVATLVRTLQVRLEDGGEPGQARQGVVGVTSEVEHSALAPGDSARLRVSLEIAEGWHVYGQGGGQGHFVPTSFALGGDASLELKDVSYPQPERLEMGQKGTLPVYHGRCEFALRIEALPNAQPGRHEATLTVEYQPCNEQSCLEPVKRRIPIRLRVRPKGP